MDKPTWASGGPPQLLCQMIKYIQKLLDEIKSVVGSTWSFLTGIWNLAVHFTTTIKTFTTNAEHLVTSAIEEYEALKNITQPGNFDPKWNTRVISVPRAIENINVLIQIPLDVFNHCKTIVDIAKTKLDATEFEPEELKFLPEEFSKFLGKLLGWVGLIVDTFVSWNQVILEAQGIIDDIHTLRTDIEGLDALFLPQTSTKKTVDVTYRKRQA